jgi:hypothetical protein
MAWCLVKHRDNFTVYLYLFYYTVTYYFPGLNSAGSGQGRVVGYCKHTKTNKSEVKVVTQNYAMMTYGGEEV